MDDRLVVVRDDKDVVDGYNNDIFENEDMFGDKSVFNNIVRNDISLLSCEDRKEVFNLMNQIIFITSLSFY